MEEKERAEGAATAPRIPLTDVELKELERLLSERTAGVWKLWGMDVMADQDGTSNQETAKLVASTFDPDRPKARTFDASLICRLVNAAPSLISDLRNARRMLGQLEPLMEAAKRYSRNQDHDSFLTLGMAARAWWQRSDRARSAPPSSCF